MKVAVVMSIAAGFESSAEVVVASVLAGVAGGADVTLTSRGAVRGAKRTMFLVSEMVSRAAKCSGVSRLASSAGNISWSKTPAEMNCLIEVSHSSIDVASLARGPVVVIVRSVVVKYVTRKVVELTCVDFVSSKHK